MTCVVLDWDDTILSTSHITTKGYKLDNDFRDSETEEELRNLEQEIIKLIGGFLSRNCLVFIITNAQYGWVQRSVQQFLPNVVGLILRCRIISARSLYENIFPKNPVRWKYEAVKSIIPKVDFIISLGDSFVEREAIRTYAQDKNILVKTLKYVNNPTSKELVRQHALVNKMLDYICSHNGELDLALTISCVPATSCPIPA